MQHEAAMGETLKNGAMESLENASPVLLPPHSAWMFAALITCAQLARSDFTRAPSCCGAW